MRAKHHALDRLGHLRVGSAHVAQAVPVAFERAGLEQGADELLEEEGIALGPLQHPLLQLGREGARAHEADQQLAVRLAVQRRERQLRGAIGGRVESGRAQALPGGRPGRGGPASTISRGASAVTGKRCCRSATDELSSQWTSSSATTTGPCAGAPLEQLAYRVEGAPLDHARVGAGLGQLAGLEDRRQRCRVLAAAWEFARPVREKPPEGRGREAPLHRTPHGR